MARPVSIPEPSAPERPTAMTTKMKYAVLLVVALPALLNAQVLRFVSFSRDSLTGNCSLTWSNDPPNLYCRLLVAHSADDDSWLPSGDLRTTNSMTTIQVGHPSPPTLFFRIVGSTNALSPPSFPQFQVPFANLHADGNVSDWTGIQPAITDRAGDAYLGPAGSDITALYLARDNANVYLRLDLANGPPASSLAFNVAFYTNYSPAAGDRFVGIYMWNTPGSQCSVEQYTSPYSGGSHTTIATGNLAVVGNVIEASVPLSALNPPRPSYVRAYQEFDTTLIVGATFP